MKTKRTGALDHLQYLDKTKNPNYNSTNEMKIKLPFKVEVSDYHEFDGILDLLKELSGSKHLKFEECGLNDKGKYLGVFFVNKKKAEKLLRNSKKICQEAEDDLWGN